MAERQRTLVIVHSLKLGGMERVAVNLAEAFAEADHDSHLMSCRRAHRELAVDPRVTLHVHDQLRALLYSVVGIPVFLVSRLLLGVLLPRSHFIWTGWLGGWLLARKIRRLERRHGRFDRIIFRGLGTFKYFWGFRDPRCRYVLENVIHHDRPAWQKRWEWRLVFQERKLVCVSSGVRDSARAAFEQGGIRPASLQVITNPCPIETIRNLAGEAEPDLPAEPYIVNVARLVPQKGHALLLEAFARVRTAHSLVIVGDGELRESLEAKARSLGIADRVLFAGKRSNPYPWMAGADLFVLASEYEGLGIVLTEALACGTPILSVDCPGGVRDVFRGELEAFLSPRTPEALAAHLQSSLARLPIPVKDDWLAAFQPEHIARQFLA
ncbi:MAG: glycosyl transferase [Haliea sp.]|nr:glycosyl transferase [Haliea sp.]|tara:strand:- start:24784 stop:25929 length:1146 start_codon:yes stop_codon:yes gene_type:complete